MASRGCDRAPERRSVPGSSCRPSKPARNVESPGAQPHQRLVAVIALVGHHLFDPRTLRLHRLDLLRRLDQGLRQRGPIAIRRILHRHRDDGARVHVDRVLGLVGQVRPTVLHLRDLRVRVLRRFPLLVRCLVVPPRPVEPSQIRLRRRLHTRRFRQPPDERLVGLPHRSPEG